MSNSSPIEVCCVADGFCDAPANLHPPRRAKHQCDRCGERVCAKCSINYVYTPFDSAPGLVGTCDKLCHTCVVDVCGEYRGEEIVRRHLMQLAGYNPMPMYDVEYEVVFTVRAATMGKDAAFMRQVCRTMEDKPLDFDDTYKFLKSIEKDVKYEIRVKNIYQGAKKIKYERRRR